MHERGGSGRPAKAPQAREPAPIGRSHTRPPPISAGRLDFSLPGLGHLAIDRRRCGRIGPCILPGRECRRRPVAFEHVANGPGDVRELDIGIVRACSIAQAQKCRHRAGPEGRDAGQVQGHVARPGEQAQLNAGGQQVRGGVAQFAGRGRPARAHCRSRGPGSVGRFPVPRRSPPPIPRSQDMPSHPALCRPRQQARGRRRGGGFEIYMMPMTRFSRATSTTSLVTMVSCLISNAFEGQDTCKRCHNSD